MVTLLSVMLFAAAAVTARKAVAEPPPPVDVVIHEAPPPRRVLSIEWNPLALIIGKWLSVNLVVAPIDHHALVLSPFYASTTTVPICVVSDSGAQSPDCMASISVPAVKLPKQTFSGFGGELGYRYYVGLGGPRGLFAGPSLLIASMTAKAADGSETQFLDYGLAADIGYEALVADRIALTLGGGVQYTTTNKSLPNQQLPAAIYANGGVRPRLLVALGYAF
jgi:hypothetical protein